MSHEFAAANPGIRDPFRLCFLAGAVAVGVCLTALTYGVDAMVLPLGLGGLVSVVISFFTYIGWNEETLEESGRVTASPRERYLAAGACSPFAIVWLTMWAYAFYADEYATHTWPFLFLAVPLWVILIGCAEGLAGGIKCLLDKHSRGHWSSIPITIALIAGLVYMFFFHEAEYVVKHRAKCESLGQTQEVRQNAIGFGTHYACSGDPQPLYRSYY